MPDIAFDPGPILQLGFFITLLIYTIFSAILFYHWQSYSTSQTVTLQTYIAYLITSFPLLLIMAVIAF